MGQPVYTLATVPGTNVGRLLCVGAVIVAPDNRLVAAGRNRVYEESAPPHQVAGTALAHAEVNALLQIRSDDPDRASYSLYTSVEPCPLCCGAAYMSGLREIYFAARDSYAGSTNVFGKTAYLTQKDIRVHGPYPDIEAVVLTLSIDRFFRLSMSRTIGWRMDYWRNDCPQAVALAQVTHERGLLQAAVREHWATSEVVDYLSSELSRHRV